MFGIDQYTNSVGVFVIGNDGSFSYGYNGWLDEIRVSKGIARWTANFTPPSSAYTRPANNFSGGGYLDFLAFHSEG